MSSMKPNWTFLGNGQGHATSGDAGLEGVEGSPCAGGDRVLITARDEPSTYCLPAVADPTADHEDEALRNRRSQVERKHELLGQWMRANGYDAVVLGRTDSLAWFTSGADLGQTAWSESGSAVLFVTPNCRAVVTDNVHSARVFEEELAGLGFQLKERRWDHDPITFAGELGYRKRVATDNGLFNWPNEYRRLRPLRWNLDRLERQLLRELGRRLAKEVEATCWNFLPGETEADVAGHLAHRLMRQGIVPVDLRVSGDDRLSRHRQPLFKGSRIERSAVITATGRRHGLCASLTRMVAFGRLDDETRARHGLAAMVDATCIYHSRPGASAAEIHKRARRIFEKYDRPDEWTLDYPGFLTGYSPREACLGPGSATVLGPDMAVSWSPSAGGARSQDTILVHRDGFEPVTRGSDLWPRTTVLVKNYTIERPGILERPR